MPSVRKTRYAGRSVFRYNDPLTEARIHLLDRFVFVGDLPMEGAFPHTVKDGEQLDGLAHTYFGNARWWWIIQLYNQRENLFWALNPTPGSVLVIPNLEVFLSIVWPKILAGKEM
jgi:hypothetical protein